MDPQLCAQLRELHALASEGVLEPAEYAQLKADALAAHRQVATDRLQQHTDRVAAERQQHADNAAGERQLQAETFAVRRALLSEGLAAQQQLLRGLPLRQAAITEATRSGLLIPEGASRYLFEWIYRRLSVPRDSRARETGCAPSLRVHVSVFAPGRFSQPRLRGAVDPRGLGRGAEPGGKPPEPTAPAAGWRRQVVENVTRVAAARGRPPRGHAHARPHADAAACKHSRARQRAASSPGRHVALLRRRGSGGAPGSHSAGTAFGACTRHAAEGEVCHFVRQRFAGQGQPLGCNPVSGFIAISLTNAWLARSQRISIPLVRAPR